MSVVNYSVPFGSAGPSFLQAPSQPPIPNFLGGPEFSGYGAAAAINSLLYNSPQPSVSAPSRKQATRSRTVKRPISTQPQLQHQHQHQQQETEETADPYYYYSREKPANGPRVSHHYLPVPEPQQRRTDAKRKPPPTPPPPQPEEVDDGSWPDRPPGYTRISNTFNSAPEPGAKTSVHAVLDFDDDFDDYNYEEDIEPLPAGKQKSPKPHVTPIEGPIFIKNGSVPVVPLYSYPTVNNGSLVQIPILWTALSVALGLEIRGEIIRGVPCIKRYHQLFCPTAGNSYPIDRIERFIDDNKALMKRMYGEFQMSTEYGPPAREVYERRRSKRDGSEKNVDSGGLDPLKDEEAGESYFAKHRKPRQSLRNSNQNSETGRVDACESKVEIVTPYWASNSAGKVRAIVNTQHFEQAIHQEVCSKGQTKRCLGDCGCEQKYKWHRLLAYDPDNDCKGIFMDWFLFPSCCVCRCAPLFPSNSNSNSNNNNNNNNNNN